MLRWGVGTATIIDAISRQLRRSSDVLNQNDFQENHSDPITTVI